MNEYEKFRQQTEEEHNAKIVDEAKQYNQRLEERLTKTEHSLCIIAQALTDFLKGRREDADNNYRIWGENRKSGVAISKSGLYREITLLLDGRIETLTQLIADLQPEPSSVSITLPDGKLPDNGCNDPSEPQREYGEDG